MSSPVVCPIVVGLGQLTEALSLAENRSRNSRKRRMKPMRNQCCAARSGPRKSRPYKSGVALTIAATLHAAAQSYPNKPIRLIVPLAAGGAADIVAPSAAGAAGEGAGPADRRGEQARRERHRSAPTWSPRLAPDGHTLGISMATQTTVNPAVNTSMPYDTEKDLQPIVLVGKSPMMFLANVSDAGEDRRRVHRAREGQPGQVQLCDAWCRQPGASRHRVLEQPRRHQDPARAVQGRRTGDPVDRRGRNTDSP